MSLPDPGELAYEQDMAERGYAYHVAVDDFLKASGIPEPDPDDEEAVRNAIQLAVAKQMTESSKRSGDTVRRATVWMAAATVVIAVASVLDLIASLAS